MWRSESLNQRPGHLCSSRIDQTRELLQMLIDEPLRLTDSGRTDEDCPFDGRTEFDRRARESVPRFVVVGAARLRPGSGLLRLLTGLPDFLHSNRDPGLNPLGTRLIERGSVQGFR